MRVRNALVGAAAASALLGSLVMAQPQGGMGPGMMGGYGGPGMMGGYGGPGMMGGYGGPGMGMMWGRGADAYAGLNLSAEQRKKIADIQQEARKGMWQLMGTMHEQDYHMYGMFGPAPLDEQAANRAYEAMAATHKAMFQLRLDAHKKIDAVLTNEQREQLRRNWGGR